MADTSSASSGKLIFSFFIMLGLTVASFLIVATKNLSITWIFWTIFVLAWVQVFFQLYTFMHLNEKGSQMQRIFILTGFLFSIIIAFSLMYFK
ncbi:cytochrome C oxidase subunit IV family protein [Mechercharimyces sp. CAU 1602]|uniref:cytochrome C oxidase subunit IV family protein n=1 Tax=Mechercharimyces sp. CAU 1602 TaxID=2973933 RepID=UPI0021625A79|nr:cytochrome C oxidase subunit IV family protein [Mechercharimyces sp. CAU 1602]MCS1352765.1 cytochrome C oxidase subunit IV family protein [Mechercharimyces sp. CAU 1602]